MQDLHHDKSEPALPGGRAGSYPACVMKALLQTTNSIQPLLLRLALGAVFFPHGAQKVLGWFGGYGFTGTMGFFTGTLHIPAILAFLAILAEFAGSLALILGFFTRVAAFGIASVMTVAILAVHSQFGFFMNWTGNQKGEGIEYHLLTLAIAAVLMIAGGGLLSIDRLLSTRSATAQNQSLANPAAA